MDTIRKGGAVEGTPGESANSAYETAIRTLREQSNSAIDARDADRVTSFMLPDVSVSVAGGPRLVGRDASRRAFATQFADPAFRGYRRAPESIAISTTPLRAVERGQWTGTWRTRSGDHVMRGTYVAEWHCTDLGWLLASEVFAEAR